jgi:protein ImuA
VDIQALLKHPNLWRAGQISTLQGKQQDNIPTGYSQLDTQLPGHGWPAAGLMECLLANAGIGELRLLAPALATLSHQQNRWVAWINPPFIPYAPALQAIGVDINKILLIHPRNHKDALWALERASKSGSCSSALAWLDEKKLKLKDTQRLQLAAKQGHTFTCLFRPHNAAAQASMAELRVRLRAGTGDEVQLDILKRRGSWPVENLMLPVAEVTRTQHPGTAEITQQLELWRALQAQQPNNLQVKQQNDPQAKQRNKHNVADEAAKLYLQHHGQPAISSQGITQVH